ncbi:MAG TPA: methyltransferase [Thermomicrobiales bacterium]|nr:methyltransferase [Thermomicrobiales bacterium]
MADAGTIRHFEALGVDDGWNCLEAGAGGGSMTAWLCDRVGPDGSVVAVDINTRFVEDLDRPNLEVRQLNVVDEALPAGQFDLVHTRAVLAHLPNREPAIDNLTNALAPNGWLLAEEMDFLSVAPVPGVDPAQADRFMKLVDAHHQALAGKMDPFFGRRVTDALCQTGLDDIGSEGRTTIVRGGSPGATAWALTFEQLSETMLEHGWVRETELAEVYDALEDPSFAFQSMVFMAAWGRKRG